MHIILVVGLKIICFERNPLHAKAMIVRNKFFCGDRILHPLTYPPGDIFGNFRISIIVREDLTEVSQPNTKPWFIIKLVVQGPAFLAGGFIETTPVGFMFKTAGRTAAGGKDLFVSGPYIEHLPFGYFAVVERGAPVGPALKHRQFTNLVCDFADYLDSRRSGANDGDLLV